MARQVVVSEYWLHRPTEALWAVTLVDDALVGACGPLAAGDITIELLHYLPYSATEAQWVAQSRSDFVRQPRYGRLGPGAGPMDRPG